MITVPQPRVLDGNLQEVRRLQPLAASISLVAQGTGEATLTLAAADPRPAMHQWVELFTQHGSAGLYRVTGISNTYTGETQITLRHGIDTLSDSVYPVQAEEATLTVQQLLVNILSYQTARVAGGMPWQLGTCEDTTSVKRAFNYDNLASLLQGLEEEKQNFYFTYDFATTPWTLNFVRKPQDVRCEFRLTRNIEGVTVTLDDSELCTQLLLSVNVLTTTTPTSTVDPDVDWPTITANDSAVRTYDNAAAQAEWGIVQKTASIDTQDDIIGQEFPNADAWAARFMADHSQPTLQIQITGEDLSELTGDTFDELALAALCRVALPDHDALFSERVVTVTYPDVYGAPTSVTVSLANRLPRFSSSIAQAQKEAARAESTAKTARRSAGGGGGGTAKELESWAMIVKKTKESADVTGLTELSETGIILDAETGAKIYSLTQGFVSQYAELNVQSGQISSLVQTTDGLSSRITQEASRISLVVTDGANPQIKPAAIVAAINSQTGQSTVKLSANIIDLSSDVTFGRNIRAEGYITCSNLYVDDADISSYTISDGRAVADESGKITIYYTDLNGVERELANFNIADTATYKAAAVDTIGVSITGDAVKDDQGVYRALAEALVTYKNGNTSTINVSAANVSKPYANGLSAAGLKIDAAKHTVTVDATDLKSATVSVSSGGWHQASGSTSTGENKISALIDNTEIASLTLSGSPGVGYSPVASSQVTPSILSSGTIYQITAYAYGVSASRYVKTPSYTDVSYARGGLNSYSGGNVVSLYYKERETYYPAGTHRWYWSSSSESLRTLYEQS